VLNAAKVIALHDDPTLARIIDQCGLINADGASVVWASRLLRRPIRERVTGIDLMHALLKKAADIGWSVYFLGGQADILEQAIRKLRRDFPQLLIAGKHDGFFAESDVMHVVQGVAESKADILFVGLPSPQKEIWIAKYLSELQVPFCMGVGGSFDVLGGKLRRAPKWIQVIGCEWMFRLAQEPRRLWKRYLITNVRFVFLLLRELLTLPVTRRSGDDHHF
jgi:N-acetylglucosaminyldiphosphoundecaprenol N-acetyl-beta-D-mannosaminyltransferase